jgi:uncharacterized membrane protein
VRARRDAPVASSEEARLDEFAGLLCIAGVAGVAAAVVALVLWRRNAELADEVRDVRRRLAALESRRDAQDTAATPPPVHEPVPPPEAPHAAPSAWIERRPAPPETPPPLPAAPPHEVPPPPAHVASPRPASQPAPMTFETFLGGRVMLVVGVVVVLFGIAFFLKYAIERDWIGPGLRVGMGVAAGAAMLAGGDRLRARGFDVFGHALMGCGLGALYLSNYFACTRYLFVGRPAGFALAGAVTALGAAFSLWRSAPLLAYLGLLGGYLAPALLGDRTGTLAGLTAWLVLVDVGALVVSLRRRWAGLDLLSLAASIAYVAWWFDEHAADVHASPLSAFGSLAVRLAAALVLSLAPSILRRAAPSGTSLLGLAVAGTLFAVAGHDLLFPALRVEMGWTLVLLSAAYATASRPAARAEVGGRGASEALLGFAVGALALAVATLAHGSAVSPALSISGLAIVFAGTRTRHAALMAGGVAMIGLAFGDVVVNRLGLYDRDLAPILNERFLVFASPCAAMLVAGWLLARAERVPESAAAFVGAAGLVALAIVARAEVAMALEPATGARHDLAAGLPVVFVAAYAFAAARVFGRGSPTGRMLAYVPLGLAVLQGVLLFAEWHAGAFAPIVNAGFAAGLAVAAVCLVAAPAEERTARAVARTTGLVYLLVLVTAELVAWGANRPLDGITREEARFAALVWISVAWALYAAALVGIGFVRDRAPVRWLGLAVFALTVGKVFLLDLASLRTSYRIGSFLVLGLLLVGASFLYQRARRVTPPPG